jgi:hypothetical protein
MKKVIDYQTMQCLEIFHESQKEDILDKYRNLNKWDEVETDSDGDIILYNFD